MTEPVPPLAMPHNLAQAAALEGRQAWLAALPNAVRDLTRRWSVTVGSPFQPGGQTAWVAPAVDAQGRDSVIKIGWRHPESADEADVLRVWAGQGAVQIYAALQLGDSQAMLLERCAPGTQLSERPEDEQDLVVARLLPRLWREAPAGHAFRPLQEMCDQWADEFETKAASGAGQLDPGLAREGISLFRSLPASASRNVLLCTDLHAGNILAAEREPWLVIDPKPYVGDPPYDALQHMLNCAERLHADPRALIERLADLLELDAGRLSLWTFARSVQESLDRPELAEVARRLG